MKETQTAPDDATTKIANKEFYRFDPHVSRLTTNKNRARKIQQCMRSYSNKRIINVAQRDLKYFPYSKHQEN